MATLEDIARSLGISKSTVSKALNGAKDISKAMRQTVLERAVEMGYSRLARSAEYDGLVSEYLEEVVDNVVNTAIGDNISNLSGLSLCIIFPHSINITISLIEHMKLYIPRFEVSPPILSIE